MVGLDLDLEHWEAATPQPVSRTCVRMLATGLPPGHEPVFLEFRLAPVHPEADADAAAKFELHLAKKQPFLHFSDAGQPVGCLQLFGQTNAVAELSVVLMHGTVRRAAGSVRLQILRKIADPVVPGTDRRVRRANGAFRLSRRAYNRRKPQPDVTQLLAATAASPDDGNATEVPPSPSSEMNDDHAEETQLTCHSHPKKSLEDPEAMWPATHAMWPATHAKDLADLGLLGGQDLHDLSDYFFDPNLPLLGVAPGADEGRLFDNMTLEELFSHAPPLQLDDQVA